MIWVGIDPGLSGAAAIFDDKAGWVRVWDLPTREIVRGRKKKRRQRLDDVAMWNLARVISQLPLAGIVIEQVGGMPRQSAAGGFTFGDLTGAVRMAFVSCSEAPRHEVPAIVWKAHYRLRGSNKDDSRALASRLFPESADVFRRKTDDGRAEAALIARWGAETIGKRPKS